RIHLAVGASTLLSFLLFALVPLPPAYLSSGFFHRPVELIPALLFGVSAWSRFRKRLWVTESFEHWVLMSLITAVAAALYMASSASLFDARHIFAHVLKIVSYQFVLTGLFISMVSIYRREGESITQLIEANRSLAEEVKERERAEGALRQVQDELESQIALRTADLIARGHQLKTTHEELSLVMASIPSILIGLDAQGRITLWNAAAGQRCGIGEAEALGRPIARCGIEWLLPDMDAEVGQWVQNQMLFRCNDLPYLKDGEKRLVGFSIRPILAQERNATTFIVTGADITERKRLERDLAQSQKLEAIGHLAAGIAHEINTPIQYVSDNIRFLEDSFGKLDS